MPLTTSTLLSFGPTVVSSKERVKLPDSPQSVGSAAGSPPVCVGIAAARATVLTTVLKPLGIDANSWNEGSSDRGVCVVDRVVSGMVRRSDGSGPVMVGYVPVQYVRVVEILGVGKTKTTEVSPYATTFVISARACRTDVPLLLVERVEVPTIGALVKVTVEVNVLSKVDKDVVLELFMGKDGRGPDVALGTTTDAEDDETLTDEVRRGDKRDTSELLDVVVLTRLDARGVVPPVRLAANEESLSVLDALPEPVDVKLIVVVETMRTDVLMKELVGLNVELNPNDGSVG